MPKIHMKQNMISILDFGVSAAILITIDFSCRWCKLNFGPLRGQVNSRHFHERMDARRQHFYILYEFLGITGRKRLVQPFWIIIWIYYYLLNGIRLDLDLDNSCWIRKIPSFATTNNINICFHTQNMVFHAPNIAWPRKIELPKLDCITNCVTDN